MPELSTASDSFLIIDDDDLFRETLRRSLLKRGYAVEAAASISEARSILNRFIPRKVVLDLRLPGEFGLDFISPLREQFPTVQIVILTGFATIDTAVATMRSGAFNYIIKPADTETILHAFETNIENELCEGRVAKTLISVEREHIEAVLTQCQGNITRAARILGIHRRSLQRKLHSYNS